MTVQRLLISAIMFILVIVSFPHDVFSNGDHEQMKFHFINVGQGDSMLIQTPEDKTILIDGGPPESEKDLLDYLKTEDIDEIDLLIVTHPDIDHIGGLPHVMKSITVNQIIHSGKLYTTKVYNDYIEQIKKQTIPIKLAKLNERITIDPQLNIQILNTYSYLQTNNESSIVLHVQYRDVDFLLMGDVGVEQEKRIIEQNDLTIDILKIGHHGSSTSSSMQFLRAVRPQIALLSYHKNNDFGHPHQDVIDRLVRIRAEIYSTATHGNIVIETNGKKYIVLPETDPTTRLLQKSG